MLVYVAQRPQLLSSLHLSTEIDPTDILLTLKLRRVLVSASWLVEVLLYVHRNRRFIMDGSLDFTQLLSFEY